jgi:hypothetical protein
MTSTTGIPVTTGGPATVTVNWTGLTAGTKYMGRIAYSNGSSAIGGTLVRIDG